MSDPKPTITFRLKTDLSKLEKKTENDLNNNFCAPGPSVGPEPDINNGYADTEINIKGRIINDLFVVNCVNCGLPIIKYTRLVPCKHAVCLQCGENLVSLPHSTCAYCNTLITGNEKVPHSQLYCCEIFDPKLKKQCGKCYLSQRDLSAHVSHRHPTSLP